MRMKLKLRFLVILSLCLSVVVVVFLSWLTDEISPTDLHSPNHHGLFKGHSFEGEVVVAGRGGHLQVLRKDLDLSNYTEHVQLEEKEAMDFLKKNLLNDPVHRTRDYLDRLVKVALEMNGESSKRSYNRKVAINQEFLPEDLNENLKRPNSFGSRGANSQEVQPLVELYPEEIGYLKKVRPRKSKRRKMRAQSLGLYLDDPER